MRQLVFILSLLIIVVIVELSVVQRIRKRHFTSNHVMWISVGVLYLLLFLVIVNWIRPSVLVYCIISVAAMTPIGTNIYGNREYFPADFQIVSQLLLLPNAIKIGDRVIPLESLDALRFAVNDWFGKKVVFNVRPYGSGPKLSRGVNNVVKLIYKDKREESIQFQLESEEQLMELAEHIKALYSSEVKIYEEYDHLRSYGLQHLTYSEIQRFKAAHQKN